MKKYLLSFLALSFAVAGVAFTNPKPAKNSDPRWYFQNSTTQGENVPTNYVPLDGQASLCPGNSSVRCVIEAPDNGGVPDLSQMTIISKKP